MTVLTWDEQGERLYETGVDHGVLFLPDESGDYNTGVAWNGLTTVTESPAGADATPQFADNIKYLNLIAAETFGGTVEAFTYPDEFAECDGTAEPSDGVFIGQQNRRVFGLCYRTRVGNDIDGTDHGYKLHLVYGAQAAPSERAYATINDSPSAIAFSWAITTTPVNVTDFKPTALLTIDSTKVDETILGDLLDILYGTAGPDPRMPLPDEIITMFEGAAPTVVDMGVPANQPTYNSGTHVITLPTVTGVQWKINGVNKSPGAQPALTPGQVAEVTAHATAGYVLHGSTDWTFDY
jgi:hypothetical protein